MIRPSRFADPLSQTPLTVHPFSRIRRGILLGFGMANAGLLGACSLTGGSGPEPSNGPEQPFTLSDHTIVSAQRLDSEVAAAFALFNHASILPDFDTSMHGARNDVALYRLTTSVTIPETQETVQVTGLLALPANATGTLPVVSWQHGTILSFDQVPSNLTKLSDPAYTLTDEGDSLESLFNIHRFAANGFAVIAADYVGKGPLRNGRSEGYAVKDVTTATCERMFQAGLDALQQLNLTPGKLFLHGWSQGSLNTQWLHQALRRNGVDITATAVASPFVDIVEAWSYWMGRKTFPLPAGNTSYPDIPAWVSLCMIIALGSYETYYRINGLLESAIDPQFHAMARKYWNDYIVDTSADAVLPTSKNLMAQDFFAPDTDERNRQFLQHAAQNSTTGWQYDRPIRFHIGLEDEATHPDMTAPLIAANPAFARGISIAGASHRAAFLAGLYGEAAVLEGNGNALSWFQSMNVQP